MAKHRSHWRQSRPPRHEVFTLEIPKPVLSALVDAPKAFHELCIETGRQALGAMMEADREGLCGPKNQHVSDRRA